MNITFFEVIIKFVSLLVISASTSLGFVKVEKEAIGVNNADMAKSSSVVNSVVSYNTITKYSEKIPSGIVNIITKGSEGIVFLDGLGRPYSVYKEKVDEVIEIGVGKYGEYAGILTGYGPDCDTCDGRGYLYCPIGIGKYFNLTTDGIYFNDEQYGNIRILAADQREFPCGTIVEVNNPLMDGPFLGIVLDTGAAMRNAYDRGYIHIDLAHETEVGLRFKTSKNTSFSVKRWGW